MIWILWRSVYSEIPWLCHRAWNGTKVAMSSKTLPHVPHPFLAESSPCPLLLYWPFQLSSPVKITAWTFSRTPQHSPIIFKAGGGFTRYDLTGAAATVSACAGPGFLQHRYVLLPFARLSSFLLLFLAFSLMLTANFGVAMQEQWDLIYTANTGVILPGRSPMGESRKGWVLRTVCGANSESCTLSIWKMCDFKIYAEILPIRGLRGCTAIWFFEFQELFVNQAQPALSLNALGWCDAAVPTCLYQPAMGFWPKLCVLAVTDNRGFMQRPQAALPIHPPRWPSPWVLQSDISLRGFQKMSRF